MQPSENNDIKLSGLLKEKYIDLDLKGKNKKEIISELVDLAAISGKIKDKKAFHKALVNREKLGSTAIGGGVAIPHTKAAGVNKEILVFGRVNNGVDFNSLDAGKTYIFFMVVSSDKDAHIGTHLKILAKISHLIRDKFIVEFLRKAKNKKEVLKLINYTEESKV